MKIILFDGVCNLCNSTINFIIDNDTNNEFKFGSLQSDAASKLKEQYRINIKDLSSIILIENDNVFYKSTAIIKIMKSLDKYKWFKFFVYIPKAIRDTLYMFIAKNRYKLFGKKDSCRIPTPDLLNKFIN